MNDNSFKRLTKIQIETLELLSQNKIMAIDRMNMAAIENRNVAQSTRYFLTDNKFVTRKDKTKAITTKGNGYVISELGLKTLELNLSIKRRGAPKVRLTEKKCPKCNATKPISDFVDNSGIKNPRGKYCSACHIAISYENLRNIFEGRETCLYCGSEIIKISNSHEEPLTKWEDIHLDHMDPLSLGGKDNERNTVYCCANCNLKKGNKSFSDWLQCLDEKQKALSRNIYIQKHKRSPEEFKPSSNVFMITFSIEER